MAAGGDPLFALFVIDFFRGLFPLQGIQDGAVQRAAFGGGYGLGWVSLPSFAFTHGKTRDVMCHCLRAAMCM
jgi:hypothetical protein